MDTMTETGGLWWIASEAGDCCSQFILVIHHKFWSELQTVANQAADYKCGMSFSVWLKPWKGDVKFKYFWS